MGKVVFAGWLVLWRDEPVKWFKPGKRGEAWARKLKQKLGPEARYVEVSYSSALME